MRLRELQRWMASTIMRPLTADFRMPTDGNDKLLGVIDSLIAPSPKLSSLQRLEIYNRQYWFRLLDSLREDFPALVRLVGDTVFRGLAEDYLQRNPSRSFTLRNLGSRLSSWLQGLADQELRESESWHAGLRYPLQLLADVAALEWAYIEAFDSAEVPSLGGEDFGNGKLDLRLQPFVRPVALAFNISSFVVAVHNGEENPLTISQQPQTNYVAVYRRNFLLVLERVPASAFPMLEALHRGDSLESAAEQALNTQGLNPVEAAGEIQSCFTHWTSLGWFFNAARVR